MIPRRSVFGLLAIAVCVWFALGVRQALGVGSATAIVTSANTISSAQARHASSALNEASTLNPDQEVNILHGEVALKNGDAPAAQRVLDSVTQAEPKNLSAWLWLARAAGDNRQLFYRALVQVRKLEPLVRAQR
jgi:thioredoxin-like negative regulator of GroEL